MNKYTPYIIVAVVVAVIVLIVMFAKKTKGNNSSIGSFIQENTTKNNGTSGNYSGGCSASFSGKAEIPLQLLYLPGLDKEKILKCGSYSMEVTLLQNVLGITEDGKFGPNTEAAVFQKYGVKEISLRGAGA